MQQELIFRSWLKQRRRQLDLTQEALAAQVGYAVETIRKFEAGRRKPSRQIAARLADALQLPAAARAEADATVQLEEARPSTGSPGIAPCGLSTIDAGEARP